jgi:hypothetical protein
MGLYQANVPLFKIRGGSQRVVVDASLRFESHSIRCDRQTLLLLALGLGVDPHRNRLDRIPEGTDGCNVALTDADRRTVMSIMARSLAVQLSSGLSFSERRALAWFCLMVVRAGGRLQRYAKQALIPIFYRTPKPASGAASHMNHYY